MTGPTSLTDRPLRQAERLARRDPRCPSAAPWTELVRLAVDTDDPGRLIAAAARALDAPVGAIGDAGETLGHAPGTEDGRRALEIAATARTSRTAPRGWRVVPIRHAGVVLGVLAVDEARMQAQKRPLLDLVTTLLGEQLKRAALVRAQTTAVLRRLINDPRVDAQSVRADAVALGVTLADAYWPAVLVWDDERTPAAEVERLQRERREPVMSRLITMLGHRMVLLHPDGDGDPLASFERVVAHARAIAPSSRAQAVAAERPATLDALATEVMELDALCGRGRRTASDTLVLSARRYAVDRLWREVSGTVEAQHFVEDRLAPLIAWDRQHGSDLLGVLEVALDYPLHAEAASRCYMHRNTFRHRLRTATRVLGAELEDPDTRLAVHVALKLRGSLGR